MLTIFISYIYKWCCFPTGGQVPLGPVPLGVHLGRGHAGGGRRLPHLLLRRHRAAVAARAAAHQHIQQCEYSNNYFIPSDRLYGFGLNRLGLVGRILNRLSYEIELQGKYLVIKFMILPN